MPGDVTGSLIFDAAHGDVRVPAGPGLHQPAARRRDQPHAAEDPVGAAGGDGGAAGHASTARPRRCREPFLVAATQNPVEYEGTYPLPEAQLDRFLLKLVVPLPAARRRARGAAPPTHRVRPARPRRRRPARRSPPPPTSPPAWRPCARSTIAAEVLGLHRRHRPGHPGVAVARARRLARVARPRCWHLAGVGVADRARLRHPRRRQGPRPRRRSRTGSRCAPRPSSRASRADSVLDERARHRCRSPADGACTWPAVACWLVAGRGARRRVAVARWPGARGSACSRCCRARRRSPSLLAEPAAALAIARGATAGAARRDRDRRRCPSPTPPARACAARCATRGRRPRARPSGTASTAAAGERRRAHDRPAADPARRPPRRPGHGARRSGRWGWRPGSGRSRVAGSLRALPPFASRKHLPARLAALRQLDGRAAVRTRGQGTEFDTCATTSRATTCARSTGAPPPGASTSSCAPGSPSAPARRHRRSTPRAPAPAGSATRHAWTPRWTPRCCSPHWPVTRRRPGRPARRRPGGARAGQRHRPGQAAARHVTPWRRSSRAGRGRLVGARHRGRAARHPPGPGRAAHRAGVRPRSRRGCCRCSRALSAHHRVVVASVTDPALAAMRAGRGTTGEVYDAAAAERAVALRRRTAAALEQPRRRRRRRGARRAAAPARRPLPHAQAAGPALGRDARQAMLAGATSPASLAMTSPVAPARTAALPTTKT